MDSDFMERIASSAKNQSSFLWHVNWPEYEDKAFLEQSVLRYEMMLALMKRHPQQFIVPTYDIDNIWHTHLAFPSKYIEDCRKLAGREINHDDDVGHDRAVGGFLSKSVAKTELLWNAFFATPWRKKGGMYRGEPPTWYWSDRLRASALPQPAVMERTAPTLRLADLHTIEIVGRAFGTAGSTEVHALRRRMR